MFDLHGWNCGDTDMNHVNFLHTQIYVQSCRAVHRHALIVMLCRATLSACAAPPPPRTGIAASATCGCGTCRTAVISAEHIPCPPTSNCRQPGEAAQVPYELGPNDIIPSPSICILNCLTPQEGTTSGMGGAMVTSDGTVSLPLVGNVNVGGLTIDAAQQKINAAFAAYVNKPNVTIQLVAAQSLRYYLLGAFSAPGREISGARAVACWTHCHLAAVSISPTPIYIRPMSCRVPASCLSISMRCCRRRSVAGHYAGIG